jgi:plastocyanin
LSAQSGVSVTLALDNRDIAVPHDVLIDAPGAGRTETCAGPCVRRVTFTAPAPGSYQFYCTTHPADMKGTLVVTP